MTRAKSCLIGPLSGNSHTNRNFVPAPTTFQRPQRICNSLSEGTYSAPKWQHREGSQQFLAYPSKGVL